MICGLLAALVAAGLAVMFMRRRSEAKSASAGDEVIAGSTTGSQTAKVPLVAVSLGGRVLQPVLCPALVVPPEAARGQERIFAVREHTFSSLPRATSLIRDSGGVDVAAVEGTCISVDDRIVMRSGADRRSILCEVQRDGADENVFNIYSQHQDLFGMLERDAVEMAFTFKSAEGSPLLVFSGNFADKDFLVKRCATDSVVAQAGRDFFSCTDCSHYQIRIAAGADAALILACSVVIDESNVF